MKVALYIRVSTEKQELENQLRPLQEFAAKRGFEVVQIYKDIATGKNSYREAFNEMMKEAHQRKFNAILVWALDRLSREGLSKTVNLIEHLGKIGIDVISYSEPYLDTTNELARNVLLAVVSTLAKAEGEKISERTRAGLDRIRRQGKKLGRPATNPEIRKKAAALIKRGNGVRETARALGVSHPSIINWLNNGKKRGAKTGGLVTVKG